MARRPLAPLEQQAVSRVVDGGTQPIEEARSDDSGERGLPERLAHPAAHQTANGSYGWYIVLSEPQGATAADAVKRLNEILQSSSDKQLVALWRAGYRFNLDDIVIRHGSPLAQCVDSLAKLL